MLNKKISLALFGLAFLGLLLAPIAIANPTGAETSVGAAVNGSGTDSETATIAGGEIREVNITGTSITGKWAGFWGTISGGIILSDDASNNFFEWTVTDVTDAYVFAALGGTTDFTGMAALTSIPGFVDGSASDDFVNTFNQSLSFQTESISIASVPATYTLQDTSSEQLPTFALQDGANTPIFAARALQGADSFQGETVDYQMLVPADGVGGATYNFYLELP